MDNSSYRYRIRDTCNDSMCRYTLIGHTRRCSVYHHQSLRLGELIPGFFLALLYGVINTKAPYFRASSVYWE